MKVQDRQEEPGREVWSRTLEEAIAGSQDPTLPHDQAFSPSLPSSYHPSTTPAAAPLPPDPYSANHTSTAARAPDVPPDPKLVMATGTLHGAT